MTTERKELSYVTHIDGAVTERKVKHPDLWNSILQNELAFAMSGNGPANFFAAGRPTRGWRRIGRGRRDGNGNPVGDR